MGEDIRRRVVASFRNAIDFEKNNNNLEAYRKYLDGLALVAAALQQDAQYSWVEGNPNLTDKERRSLLGFAKQSADRLVFLLDKRDASNIFKGTTVTTNEGSIEHSQNMPSVPHSECKSNNDMPPKMVGAIKRSARDRHEESDVSPIVRMRQENQLLMGRYAVRLRSATTKTQRHNLQLELERRLMENSVIAQQQQETWERHRSKIKEWCLHIAEQKFKINDKIENGTITEADFKKQRLFAAALQYEEEHMWLKKLKQELLSSPSDENLQRDIVTHVLNDRLHPLGSLMGQMQHAVLNKVNPLIKTKQESLPTLFNYANINEQKPQVSCLSSINDRLHSLDLNTSERGKMKNEQGTGNQCNNEHEAALADEERKAFQRHFHNIGDDIKQDIRFLEVLLYALFEPLNTEEGSNILMELLHELYFPPIKPVLIVLIRLGVRDAEEDLAERMKEPKDSLEVDECLRISCCHALRRLEAIGSPCQMLDSLGAILKTLATADDAQAKSIGADDLLPRLMAVVLTCDMPSLLAEAIYMENFMPVSRALGEAGYCLTVLQSVMTCVQIPTG